jgi:cystathionine beta-lyase/cystathionine gamma-synthase
MILQPLAHQRKNMIEKSKVPLDEVQNEQTAKPMARFSKSLPQTEPLHLSGVWRMESTEQADALLAGTESGYVYRRDGHPNASSLSEALRNAHGADEAIVTAQGMSAISIAAMALLKPGDRVLLGQPIYGRTSFLFKKDLARWGIECEDVNITDKSAWAKALKKPSRLVILETITNPRLQVPDIESISGMAHPMGGAATSQSGTVVLVDNTFATPVLCQPLKLGADLVMESLSKFVCGHADAMIGLLCGRSTVWDRIRQTMVSFGMTSSPLDCWLTQRGLASLSVRMAHAASTAMELAKSIEGHSCISLLDYPGLPSHSDFAVAQKQFHGTYGNMLTVKLHGGLKTAQKFISSVASDIPFCPTLGEAQTTLSHPVSTSHRSYSEEQLQSLGIDGGTLRFSIGLEPSKWIVEKILAGLDSSLP